jgi:hypothetical protein
MLKTTTLFAFLLPVCCLFSLPVFAQPTWTLNPFGKEKKPEQYEDKKLPSEKTGEKKFNAWRRFKQNTTTHYNYYFNANNKLNEVVERATMSNKEDFSRLLSYYPYTLENTAAQQTELDSVIYKSTAAILLHDLRSDWVDNMYLLIGKAYYLRNELDSAAMTFQFINYNLFPRKKKEDDSRIVGTNSEPGTGYLSIANKENRNLLDKTFSMAPSRNDALVWLARTFTSKQEYGDAAGLINILRNDHNLPARLKNDLEEVTAYWFFAQNSYDSAAVHLENALSVTDTKQDKSRWEFLLAQLFERQGQFDKASGYYDRAAKHTVDPIMEIYARLNDAKMMRDNGDEKQLDISIANLLKMAKKDKYDNYRDIIYYSAAQLGLKKPDTTNSIVYLQKAIKYNSANTDYRNKSFFQLGNIAYNQARFKDASSLYDSLQLSTTEPDIDLKALNERKESLAKLVKRLDNIAYEDSLQRIAAMPVAEREAFVKKILRKLRKEQGLKEEDAGAGTAPITFAGRTEETDLFTSNSSKGEWYFYNNNLKTKGYNEFVSRWGKRNNVDNWRRKKSTVGNLNLGNVGGDVNTPINVIGGDSAAVADLTIDGLMLGLPLTPEKLDTSNRKIAINMLELAKVFQNDLQEYQLAIDAYDNYLNRFPGDQNEAEAYLGLYFSFNKLGNTAKANYYKNLVTTKHAASPSAALISNPSLLQPNLKNAEGTARYEGIYNLFIEGKFTEALESKKKADSLYGNNFWTPQLLYIESVYHIREKNDSLAIGVLKNLQALYPTSPLSEKAGTMIEVLGKRAQIEDYLTKLEVTRAEEERIIISDDATPVVKAPAQAPAPVVKQNNEQVIKPISRDTSFVVPPVSVNAGFSIQPEKAHFVVVLLDKVDGVYINEAKNAFTRFNKGSYLTQNLVINRDTLDANRTLFLVSKFEDAESAIAYHDKIKKAAPREVSWLPANKYSFFIISEDNLQLLKTNKDLEGYKKLLNASLGNKF